MTTRDMAGADVSVGRSSAQVQADCRRPGQRPHGRRGNAAVAAASCQDCTTVAIAIEGVLVHGDDVDTVRPVNITIALNTDCSGCQTLAAAYQYVTQDYSRVRITGEGRQTIAMLRQQLNTLRRQDLELKTLRQQDLTLEQVAAKVDHIALESAMCC